MKWFKYKTDCQCVISEVITLTTTTSEGISTAIEKSLVMPNP